MFPLEHSKWYNSSLVTSIAQKVNKKPINTFPIGFKEAKYNSNYYKKLADHLKTNHTEFILTEKEAIDELENICFILMNLIQILLHFLQC